MVGSCPTATTLDDVFFCGWHGVRGPPCKHQPLHDKIGTLKIALGDSGFLQFFKGLFQVIMVNPVCGWSNVNFFGVWFGLVLVWFVVGWLVNNQVVFWMCFSCFCWRVACNLHGAVGFNWCHVLSCDPVWLSLMHSTKVATSEVRPSSMWVWRWFLHCLKKITWKIQAIKSTANFSQLNQQLVFGSWKKSLKTVHLCKSDG